MTIINDSVKCKQQLGLENQTVSQLKYQTDDTLISSTGSKIVLYLFLLIYRLSAKLYAWFQQVEYPA